MVQRHQWFEPMLLTIAKRRVAAAPLGLKARLAFGASLSIGDMASDILTLINLFLAGRMLSALLLLGLIVLNLAFQALVTILQNAHCGWRVVLQELGVVFSLLKPAIDAIRVAGGQERIEGAPLDPFTEMLFCKLSELALESAPGGLAQAIFIFNAGEWSTAAAVSVGLSCLSAAFTATSVAYDIDTNADRRRNEPHLNGYIPDAAGKRVLVFALLFLYHAVYSHAVYSIGQTLSMAVLAKTRWLWLALYFLADHVVFILYKLARGDLVYWVPGLGIPLSLLARFMAKVVADFTGLVHCRHPLELGGIYFFVNTLMHVASWFVAAALYSRYSTTGRIELALGADMHNSTGVNSTGVKSTGAHLRFRMPLQAAKSTLFPT
jgi:hypothetical protein